MIIVDDVHELLSPIERSLKKRYDDYKIYAFTNARDALTHVGKIDQNGDQLVLVATDERMGEMQGHELLGRTGESHPTARRILYSGYTDYGSLQEAINQGVHKFVQKATANDSGNGLYPVVEQQLKAFEKLPKIEIELGDIVIKLADTKYEKEQLFACRYRNYLGAKHLTIDDFTEEQKAKKQEWDEYDNIPGTRYVVAKNGGSVIGGARIVEVFNRKIPMETGISLKNGEPFCLDDLREKGIHTREVSRLVVDHEHRTHDAEVLTGIFRIIANLTLDHDTLLCTARERQVPLYKAIGFELFKDSDNEPIRIKYKSGGAWYPMMQLRTKTLEEPEKIDGFFPEFYFKSTKMIDKINPEEWIAFSHKYNEMAEQTGFYQALFVNDEK